MCCISVLMMIGQGGAGGIMDISDSAITIGASDDATTMGIIHRCIWPTNCSCISLMTNKMALEMSAHSK